MTRFLNSSHKSLTLLSLFLLLGIAGCSTQPKSTAKALPTSQVTVIHHYQNDSDDVQMSEVAILKSSNTLGNDVEGVIQLLNIDEHSFSNPNANDLGPGQFELHVLPGTYTLKLSYDHSEVPAASEKTFVFTALPGHTYLLDGALSEDKEIAWFPILFDTTRVMTWKKDKNKPTERTLQTDNKIMVD